MSHFCVMVRLPAKTRIEDFDSRIGEMLLPYKESGCGDSDPPGLKQYLKFYDIEDEYRQKYESETTEMVRLSSGEVCSLYDERFRNPELFSTKGQFIIPHDAVQFKMAVKECYPTFEQYMKDYCGYSGPDSETGRYGYWQNPNKKWDWWTVGGRWTGYFLLGYDPSKDRDNYERCFICNGTGTRLDAVYTEKDVYARQTSPAGHPVIGRGCNSCGGTGRVMKFASKLKPVGNYVRVRSLDWQKIEQEAKKRLEEFWIEWQDFCNGKEFDTFDGPRDKALSMGLIECKDARELTGREWRLIPWDKPETPAGERRNRVDVLKEVTREELLTKYLDHFNPLSSWARLDADGWQQKGEMGWWGTSNATPETTQQHAQSQQEWIMCGDPEDWLVIVDCHI